jgi:hypothetical protein
LCVCLLCIFFENYKNDDLAKSRDDIARFGCFACGGPHFRFNKRTGWRCPGKQADQKLVSSKLVLPKPVAAAVNGAVFFNPQQPSQTYAAAVSSSDSEIQKLKNEVRRQHGQLLILKGALREVVDFLNKECEASGAIDWGFNVRMLSSKNIFQSSASTSVSPAPGVDVSRPESMSSAPQSSTPSSTVVQPSSFAVSGADVLAQPAPKISVDQKRVSAKLNDSFSTASGPKSSLPDIKLDQLAPAPASSPATLPSSAFSIPKLSPEEAKSAFARPSTSTSSEVSKNVAKRRRQTANRKRAKDYFGSTVAVGSPVQ